MSWRYTDVIARDVRVGGDGDGDGDGGNQTACAYVRRHGCSERVCDVCAVYAQHATCDVRQVTNDWSE